VDRTRVVRAAAEPASGFRHRDEMGGRPTGATATTSDDPGTRRVRRGRPPELCLLVAEDEVLHRGAAGNSPISATHRPYLSVSVHREIVLAVLTNVDQRYLADHDTDRLRGPTGSVAEPGRPCQSAGPPRDGCLMDQSVGVVLLDTGVPLREFRSAMVIASRAPSAWMFTPLPCGAMVFAPQAPLSARSAPAAAGVVRADARSPCTSCHSSVSLPAGPL